jgi:hypothetical protein
MLRSFNFFDVFLNCDGPSTQRLRDAGNFAPHKSILEPTWSHKHPAAFVWKIGCLERCHDTMAGMYAYLPSLWAYSFITEWEEKCPASPGMQEDNDNNKKPAAVDKPAPPLPLPVPPKKKAMTRWPQMTSLMAINGPYKKEVLRILQGIYECNALTEVNAQDGNNVKANAWIKFHDHCFGGGKPNHGLVNEFPFIAKPTFLKAKILQIWKYAIANYTKVPKEIYEISLTQFCIYCDACKQEKEAKENAGATMAKLKDDMHTYEVE